MRLKNNKVIIVCDGSQIYGFGHIKRSKSLEVTLKKNGFITNLIILSELKDENFINVFEDFLPSSIFFDVPYDIEELIYFSSKKKCLSIALDYFGNGIPDINIVIYPHKKVRAKLANYFGVKYIIIRPDILKYKLQPFTKVIKKILIIIGGSDINYDGYKAAKLLSDQNLEIQLVAGPFVDYPIEKDIYELKNMPENLPALFYENDLIVTNGGGALFEAIYLGKLIIALPQTIFEKKIVKFFKSQNYLLGQGFTAIENLSTLNLQSINREPKIIDGLGSDRIVQILKDYMKWKLMYNINSV